MEKTFDNLDECLDSVKADLALDPASAVGEGLLNGFANACKDTSQLGGVFELQLGRWVIRDEDLKLFATVRDVISPMAAAGFVLSSLPAAGVTALAIAIVDLLRKARRFGASLTFPQSAIVAVLRAHEKPLSAAEILRELPTAEPPWTEQTVEEVLAELREIVTNNGPVAFTQQMSDGKWCLTGV